MKATLNVFIGDYAGVSPEDIGEQPPTSFIYSASEAVGSWTKIGTAEMSITLFDTDSMVAEKLAALKSQLKAERAEAQMRANAIEDKIAQLLAITNDVTVMTGEVTA